MNLTDLEIELLVNEICHDVLGEDMDVTNAVQFMDNPALTDTIHYPDDPKKQFVLESLVMGASMQNAFDHMSSDEKLTRAKILVAFLGKLGISLC